MKTYKILTLLASLSPSELKDFNKFLRNRYAKEEVGIKVFRYLKSFHPDFQAEEQLELEFMYRKIFREIPDKANQRKKLLNAFADLSIWVKDFMILETVRQNTTEGQLLWLEILQKRGLKKFIKPALDQLETDLEHNHLESQSLYYQKMRIRDMNFYNLPLKHYSPDYDSIIKLGKAINTSHAIRWLRVACTQVNQSYLHHTEYELTIPDYLLDWCAQFELEEYPLLVIYYRMYSLLKINPEQDIIPIIRIIVRYADSFMPEEVRIIISLLYNQTIRQSRKGISIPLKEVHQLNKLGLQYKLYLKTGVTEIQFNNIVNLACMAKDFEWALNYIEIVTSILPKKNRKTNYQLAKATVLFDQGKHQQLYKILNEIKTKDSLNIVRHRLLLIRNNYELNLDYEEQLNQCDAFEKYLRRHHNENPRTATSAIGFVKFARQLIYQNLPKEVLQSQIESTPYLFCNIWLLKKMKSYQKR